MAVCLHAYHMQQCCIQVSVEVSCYLVPCTDESGVVHGNRACPGLALKLAILVQFKAAVDTHCKGEGGREKGGTSHDH